MGSIVQKTRSDELCVSRCVLKKRNGQMNHPSHVANKWVSASGAYSRLQLGPAVLFEGQTRKTRETRKKQQQKS